MAKYNDPKLRASTCGPCDLYQRAVKQKIKDAKAAGICLSTPMMEGIAGSLMQDVIFEDNKTLAKLNKEYMGPFPENVLDGALSQLGELPIITLHKLAQKRENFSGKFYPEERGLARVCNPIGSSYLTARPYRCNTIYRCCEPMGSTYAGHVPGETFIPGEHRGKCTRNALKHLNYRI